MKKIEGKYKFALAILILYAILMAIIFGPRIINGKQQTYLLIGSSAKWKYDGDKWRDFTTDDISLYAWKNYDIYINQKKFGNYQVTYSEKKWYIFENDKTPVNYQGSFLGIKSNKGYHVGAFEEEDLEESDQIYLNQIYQENGLKENQKTTDAYKVSFDIDGDQDKETIYVLSNLFPNDFVPSTVFNFVFIVDNKKVQTIYKMTDAFTNECNHCKIGLQYLIDVDDDSKYELILNCKYYSTMGSCAMMYQKKGANYRRIKACKTVQNAL